MYKQLESVFVSVVPTDWNIHFGHSEEWNCKLTNTIKMDPVLAVGIKCFQVKRKGKFAKDKLFKIHPQT